MITLFVGAHLIHDLPEASTGSSLGLRKYVNQLVSNYNFRWFILMNLVQVRTFLCARDMFVFANYDVTGRLAQ